MPDETEETPRKLFDVAKPGKTPPHASSRPVIVGHHSLLQDPMIRDKLADSDSSKPVDSPGDHKLDSLEPPHDSNEPGAQIDNSGRDIPSKNLEDKVVSTDENPEDKGEEKKSEESNTPPIPEKKQPDEPKDDEAAEGKYKQLIEQKQYFVPIGAQQRTRSAGRLIAIVVLSLLAIFLIGDLLIDSGVIKTSTKPPISIFHN